MPLSAGLQQKLAHFHFTTPTPVQASAIPAALEGKDVLATAQTGTGKTLAFVLPMVHALAQRRAATGIRAVILSPTRELACKPTSIRQNVRRAPASARPSWSAAWREIAITVHSQRGAGADRHGRDAWMISSAAG